jgi:hypothetical protein
VQAFNKRPAERRKDFIHLTVTGQYAARWQQQAVVESLRNDIEIKQPAFRRRIALALVNFILVVIKQPVDVMLLAEIT